MTQAYQRRIRRPTAQRQSRTSDQWEVYYDARWRKASEAFLRQYPLCVVCLCDGRTNNGALENPSQRQRGLVVDHIVPHRGDRNLFWDQSNWETLCRYPCHDQIKQQCEIRGDDWFTRLRNYERQFYTATAIDVVRFVRKSVCPLFNEDMSGPEDADWDLRIPPVKLQSRHPLYHDDRIPLREYISKKSYYTRSMRKFHEENPDAKVLKLWYRVFGVFMENGKWKQLLKHPVMAVKLYLLIAIRAAIYLRK